MTDSIHQRFLSSMNIGWEQWHDGIGYDLEALAQLGPDDRASVEKLLIGNLIDGGDWRDVQALAALRTPSARAAVVQALDHRDTKIRNCAIRMLLRDPEFTDEDRLEECVVRAVEQGSYDMAEHLPTPRVKEALLTCARDGHYEVRPHAAALLMYLCGKTDDPFDWDMRPFFLQFGKHVPKIVEAAWEELRRRTGM